MVSAILVSSAHTNKQLYACGTCGKLTGRRTCRTCTACRMQRTLCSRALSAISFASATVICAADATPHLQAISVSPQFSR